MLTAAELAEMRKAIDYCRRFQAPLEKWRYWDSCSFGRVGLEDGKTIIEATRHPKDGTLDLTGRDLLKRTKGTNP